MGVNILRLFQDYIDKAIELSNEEKLKVLEIVGHAIRLTRTYISRTRKDQVDIPSQILSTTWQETANKLRRMGNTRLKDFAEMLEQKSRYWSDPEGFQSTLLDEYDMRLTQVEYKLKKLVS